MTLNLFPVRAPIGQVTDRTGQTYDVMMTPEFARALASLMVRIGGPEGISITEIVGMLNDALAVASLDLAVPARSSDADQVPDSVASQIAALRAEVNDLRAALETASSPLATISRLEQLRADLTADATVPAKVLDQLEQLNRALALYDFPRPIQKNTVDGSRGGNAALSSLLAALARSGLIIDSTTI